MLQQSRNVNYKGINLYPVMFILSVAIYVINIIVVLYITQFQVVYYKFFFFICLVPIMKNEVDEIFILISALCSMRAVSNLVLSIHHEIKYIHQVTSIHRFLNLSQSIRDKNFYKILWRVHGTKFNFCYSYKCNCLITFLKHKNKDW